MKIVHIAPNAPYNDYWGYQDNLLPKYHKKLGHDVTVYAILGNYDYKSFQLENKVKVRDLGKSLWGNYDSDGNSRQTLLNRAIRRLLYNIIDFPRCEYYFKAKKSRRSYSFLHY